MSQNPKHYTVREFFSSDQYIIPIYQRNYAWGEGEITQLIQDIVDYKKSYNTFYYIGTLVVWERKLDGTVIYETIDGQQRLTTLSILLSLINKEYLELKWFSQPRLKFDSRTHSTATLDALFYGYEPDDNHCNTAIKDGYKTAKRALERILNEKEFNLSIEEFTTFLLDKVTILRVPVPTDTDLNHYFEIMNSRGEQLEKHEVLKAKCLEVLDESDRYAFNTVWEACANMEKYVQYGFTTDERDLLFGKGTETKWDELTDERNFYASLRVKPEEKSKPKEGSQNMFSIQDIVDNKIVIGAGNTSDTGEESERFNTIINFSNFLLHILRIQTGENIALDDKRLIPQFEQYLKADNKKEFVRTFGYNLLKGKYLFDKYIIKREYTKGKDQWSLKKLKLGDSGSVSYVNTFGAEDSNDDINRENLMLLSMFHVSTPTLVYKHWLNAVLKFVFLNPKTEGETYRTYLENLAKAFLVRRYIANEPEDFFTLIYGETAVDADSCFDHITDDCIDFSKLDSGTAVENFIFNYLDYLLWKDYRRDKKYFRINGDFAFDDNRVRDFEFSFRSSVEHYYPQNPIDSAMKLKDKDQMWLDNFGNLCLISSSKNSRLSNFMPSAKKDHYRSSQKIDSIKQRIMMEYEYWDTNGDNQFNEIKDHGERMKEILMS
ncbi:GmrSD restriction endonuclease domain-containing protein [Paludibacter jiangxiensis]|uniref:DUF262 domain-containing protein n=1 Tax=Paludibacter jiangxiensis TaxID=681398 RepID=A0A161LSE4_9BACT|nr:DUF262 domain-containing protein [Paludibacter jiangxiensis]GAT63650.1 hypothetical protein PJIAN_4189 [Paludibacter jiangxiensis]